MTTYTTEEVCGILKCTRPTLYNIMRRAGISPRLGQNSAVVHVGPIRNFFTVEHVRRLIDAAAFRRKARLGPKTYKRP